MKKLLLLALSLLLVFACKNPQNDGGKPSGKTEEFKVNFSVKDNVGGSLTAKIKGETTSIATGKKVAKDKEVVFTATPTDSTYSVESWTLDGTPVEEAKLKNDKKEFTLKITKDVIVVVKFKENGSDPQPKDIQIDKIILGYPNISPRDGKTVLGKDLNENTTIEDFEVPDATFPIQVYHKTEFTVEEVFVTFDGGTKEKLTSSIQKTMLEKRCTLVENHKTPIVIDITGEGYKPLKLTFNVTYKKATKKYVDDITNITIATNSSGGVDTYGAVGKPIADLKGGKTNLNISIDEPTISLYVNKGSGGQPQAVIKVDNNTLSDNFEAGKNNLSFKTPKLEAGTHNVKITITKDGYEPGEYDFNLVLIPSLTFKEMTINAKKYTQLSDIKGKTVTFGTTDTDPVTLSGAVEEEGAELYFGFRKNDGKYYKVKDSNISVPQGEMLNLRMYAKKSGYTTLVIPFVVKRMEKIEIKKIEVDGKEVQNDAIEVEKAVATVKLMVHLKQKYEGISFKINNVVSVADLGEYGMIATFNNVAITKDAALQVKIEATAPNFESCEKTITITHKTPSQQETGGYITAVAVTPWDSEDGGHNWPVNFTKADSKWTGDRLSDGGPHRFTIKIDTKDKDITDVTSFKLYMKDANSSEVYFDKITGSKDGDKVIKFERSKNTMGRDIMLPEGTTTLDVKLYYGEEVVESCQIIVKR